MSKNTEYDSIWIDCRCGQKIGGTILRDKHFKFTCLKCWRIWTGSLGNDSYETSRGVVKAVGVSHGN